MKKFVMFLFIILFLNFISATQINLNPSSGIGIDYPQFDSTELNVGFNLTIHPYNNSGTNFLTGAGTSCYLEIQNHSGDIVFARTQLISSDNSYNIYVNSGNFSKTDTYHFYIPCNGSGIAGFADGLFQITQSGTLLTIQESTIYGMLIFFFFLTSMFFLYFGMTLPLNNEINPDGTITRISKAKYLKLISIMFFFGSLLADLSLMSSLSNNFASLSSFNSIITSFYLIWLTLTFGITVLIFAMLFIMIYWDIFFSKEIKKYGKAFINSIR